MSFYETESSTENTRNGASNASFVVVTIIFLSRSQFSPSIQCQEDIMLILYIGSVLYFLYFITSVSVCRRVSVLWIFLVVDRRV